MVKSGIKTDLDLSNVSPEFGSVIQENLGFLRDVAHAFGPEVETAITQRVDGLERRLSDTTISLAILGEFSSGKSTFINALLGSEILASALIPSTSVTTRILWGEKLECEALLKSGKRANVPITAISDYSSVEGRRVGEVLELQLKAPLDMLRSGLIIIDTPGVNVNIAAHERITAQAIQESNACLFLMDARQPGKKTTIEFFKYIRDRVDKFFFVMNRADILDESERQEVDDYLREVLHSECGIEDPRIVFISSVYRSVPDSEFWGRRFQAFMISLNQFMEMEKRSLIGAEAGRELNEAMRIAAGLMGDKLRLSEIELANFYNVKLPDAKSMIKSMEEQLGQVLPRHFESLDEKTDARLEQSLSSLNRCVRNLIMGETSKSRLVKNVPDQIRQTFGQVDQQMSVYIQASTENVFLAWQKWVNERFIHIFSGVKLLEARRFFFRKQLWGTVFLLSCAGLCVGFLSGERALLLPFVILGGCTGFLGYALTDMISRRKKFSPPRTVSLARALASGWGQIGGDLAQKVAKRDEALRSFNTTGARAGMYAARASISSGNPLFAGIAVGVLAVGNMASWAWDKMFGPRLAEVQAEMLKNAMAAFHEFSTQWRQHRKEMINQSLSFVHSAITRDIRAVLKRYEDVLTRQLRRQSITENILNQRVRYIQQVTEGCTQRIDHLEEWIQYIRYILSANELGNYISQLSREERRI